MAIQSIIDQALGSNIEQYQKDADSERTAIDKAIKQNVGDPTKSMKSDIDYMTANRDKMAQVKMPEASFSKEVPKAPALEENNPLDAFKSYAPAFAVFGSLLTRKPLTAALNSAASAMQAHNQGSKDAYHQKLEKFKADMETFTKQHELETDEYRANVEKAKGDISLLTALNEATAHKFQDEHMLQTMASGQAGQMIDMIEKKTKLSQDSVKTLSQVDKQLKAGQPTLSPEAITMTAEQLARGDKTALTNLGRGAQSSANIIAVRNELAKMPGMTGDKLANMDLEFTKLQSEERTLGAQTAKIATAGREFDNIADQVLETSKKVSRTDYPSLNKVIESAEAGTGDKNIVDLYTAVLGATNTYARAINPNGVARVADQEKALKALNAAYSEGQLETAILRLKKETEAARESPSFVQKGINEEMGGKKAKESSPEGVDPDLWKYLTPEQKALWN